MRINPFSGHRTQDVTGVDPGAKLGGLPLIAVSRCYCTGQTGKSTADNRHPVKRLTQQCLVSIIDHRSNL